MNNKTLLHILLVITFISAGFSALVYLCLGLMLPDMKQLVADNPQLVPEQLSITIEQLLDTPQSFFIASALLFLLELLGASLMWRLRWPGFHCYTLARLLLLLLPALFLGRAFVGIGDIMMAVLFVAVYYMLMRRLTDSADTPPNKPDSADLTTQP